jgi:serine O-acetyltransferase
VPVVGDDVDFGAYAQVLGDISLGDRCKIGAMAMVIKNVPADATAVGVPARVITVKPAIVKATAVPAVLEDHNLSKTVFSSKKVGTI